MASSQEDIIFTIKKVLQEDILPGVASHGGSVKFIKFTAGTVYIEFSGACVGCPISMYTLKYGIEKTLKKKIPQVLSVQDINEED